MIADTIRRKTKNMIQKNYTAIEILEKQKKKTDSGGYTTKEILIGTEKVRFYNKENQNNSDKTGDSGTDTSYILAKHDTEIKENMVVEDILNEIEYKVIKEKFYEIKNKIVKKEFLVEKI
jgi:hypothetical protein